MWKVNHGKVNKTKANNHLKQIKVLQRFQMCQDALITKDNLTIQLIKRFLFNAAF